MQNYPGHLVPNRQFKIITEGILDKNHYLGKWVDESVILKDEDGKLSQAAIHVKDIPGSSSNKIPQSIISDLNIKFVKEFAVEYRKDWVEGEDGVLPADDHFEIIDNRQHYFIKVNYIHNYSDTYENPPNKTESIYRFKFKVVHEPLISNYWHFEFEIDTDHKKLQKADSKWQKIIYSSIRDKIQEVAKLDL